MYKTIKNYAILIILFLMGSIALAQTPKRIALLIGNWDYDLDGKFTENIKSGYVPDLRMPCEDIKMVKKPLIDADFDVIDACNLDRKGLENLLVQFKDKVKKLPKDSLVFFYYSGHGMARHGYTFTIPVVFKWDRDELNTKNAADQIKFFQKNAIDVRDIFDALPIDFNVKVVIALDNCRENPLTEQIGYNEAVTLRPPPNALVQYSTTAGDKVADGGPYAKTLAAELAKGGDIGSIMGRVNNKMWNLFYKHSRTTYSDTVPGGGFTASSSTPLKFVSKDAFRPSVAATTRRALDIHLETQDDVINRRVRLDFLWCEGAGSEARFELAKKLAEHVNAKRVELNLGRIRIKPLSVETNNGKGYRVHQNIMRYDAFYPDGSIVPINKNIERQALLKIATIIPEAGFIPKPGIGVRGKPTQNYISAFVCLDES